MKKIATTFLLATMAAVSGTASAAEAQKAVVVSSEDMSQRCILALVVTEVDGKAPNDDAAGRFELDSGPHSFSGYGAGDPSLCATFSAEGGVKVAPGDPIGQSALKLNLEAGKEYYLGVDVRSKDKSRWKIVAWKIKH